MTKFIIGFIVGVAITIIILAAIYNEVAAGVESGSIFPSAWQVIEAWFKTLKE